MACIGAKAGILEKVRILLQQTADHARQQAKEQLETTVTRASSVCIWSILSL